MNRIATFLRRALVAPRYRVLFAGMARTKLPRPLHIGRSAMRLPDHPLIVADFVNVVLDDDYGLRSLAAKPRTVIDIGANVGLFTCHARQCFPGAIIHAYEPSPETVKFARRNASSPRITVFQEGVAAESGRAVMVEHGSSNLAQTEANPGGAIVLTAFAEVVRRIGGTVDFLKVDCEGAEWDFMRDAATFAAVKCIRMEYHLTEDRTLADVTALAEGIGFRIDRLVPNDGFGIAWLERA